jgi:hypothetical protein
LICWLGRRLTGNSLDHPACDRWRQQRLTRGNRANRSYQLFRRRTLDQLGGKVIVPPFDVPWVRMTIIGDPQGATFIASKFVRENKDLG